MKKYNKKRSLQDKEIIEPIQKDFEELKILIIKFLL